MKANTYFNGITWPWYLFEAHTLHRGWFSLISFFFFFHATGVKKIKKYNLQLTKADERLWVPKGISWGEFHSPIPPLGPSQGLLWNLGGTEHCCPMHSVRGHAAIPSNVVFPHDKPYPAQHGTDTAGDCVTITQPGTGITGRA